MRLSLSSLYWAPEPTYFPCCICPSAWGLSGGSAPGVVAEPMDITLPAGSKALLPCQSPRMVWTRDRLKDRQRVVHWDLVRSSPEYSVERVLDMSPGAHQRVYNGFNKGRVSIPDSAFDDGNFSLVIDGKTGRAVPPAPRAPHSNVLNLTPRLLVALLSFSRCRGRQRDVYL